MLVAIIGKCRKSQGSLAAPCNGPGDVPQIVFTLHRADPAPPKQVVLRRFRSLWGPDPHRTDDPNLSSPEL